MATCIIKTILTYTAGNLVFMAGLY